MRPTNRTRAPGAPEPWTPLEAEHAHATASGCTGLSFSFVDKEEELSPGYCWYDSDSNSDSNSADDQLPWGYSSTEEDDDSNEEDAQWAPSSMWGDEDYPSDHNMSTDEDNICMDDKLRLRWGENTTHFIPRTSKDEIVGTGWAVTHDLCYREFWKPLSEGGCGKSWQEFMRRVEIIDEPDFCAIGAIWGMVAGGEVERPEEQELPTSTQTTIIGVQMIKQPALRDQGRFQTRTCKPRKSWSKEHLARVLFEQPCLQLFEPDHAHNRKADGVGQRAHRRRSIGCMSQDKKNRNKKHQRNRRHIVLAHPHHHRRSFKS